MGNRVGFQLEVGPKDEQLLQSLQVNPQSAFPKPYAGYILFLFSQADREQTDWLKKHLELLDELTGDHLAFAIFAKSVEMEVDADVEAEARRFKVEGRALGSWQTGRSMGATRLVENGAAIKLQGCRLTAMTGGAVAAAKALGVTRHLPCLLIFDGVPSRDAYLVDLSSSLLTDLRDVFQRAVEAFEADGATEIAGLASRHARLLDLARAAGAARALAERQHETAKLVVKTAYAQSRLESASEKARARAARRHEHALLDLAGLAEMPDEAPAGLRREFADLSEAIRCVEGIWFTDYMRAEVRRANLMGRSRKVRSAAMEVIYRVTSDVIFNLSKPPGA